MSVVGKVESLWRYPVKSMRGHDLPEAFICSAGIYGDRLFAIKTSLKPAESPYLTGAELRDIVLYTARYYDHDTTIKPDNLETKETLVADDTARLVVYVENPAGDMVDLDDPSILHELSQSIGGDLSLERSSRSIADSQPICLISQQTRKHLSDEFGEDIDQRRFRANIYMNLEGSEGFAEDKFVGKKLRIGPKAVISVTERAEVCKLFSLDPDTSVKDGKILRGITKSHEGKAGIYGTVLEEGMARAGDEIVLLD
ncbi:MAG: MOSC domain-containing protein [Nitrospinales bacterium]